MSHSNPTPKRARKPYTYFSERIWARCRQAYLDGDSARLVSEQFGPTVHAIRKRIRREGWTKRSLLVAQEAAHPELNAEEAVAAAPSDPREAAKAHALKQASGPVATPTPEPVEPRIAARTAMAEAAKLMKLGRMSSAFEAARIADLLARTADRLTDRSEGAGAEPEDDEAAFEAVRTKVLGDLSPIPAGEVSL